jgi:hypothetical protein
MFYFFYLLYNQFTFRELPEGRLETSPIASRLLVGSNQISVAGSGLLSSIKGGRLVEMVRAAFAWQSQPFCWSAALVICAPQLGAKHE